MNRQYGIYHSDKNGRKTGAMTNVAVIWPSLLVMKDYRRRRTPRLRLKPSPAFVYRSRTGNGHYARPEGDPLKWATSVTAERTARSIGHS